MQGEAILETIAELSVAFTGFTGVVAVLGRRSAAPWAPLEVFRFRVLLGASLAALLFSLLPFPLHYARLSEEATWRTGSTLVAIHLATVAALDARSLAAVRREAGRQALLGLEAAVSFVAVIVFSVQVLNAFGYFSTNPFAPYFGALLYYLLVSALNFVRLLARVGVDIGGSP
jgi:hypothetical protein